MLEIWSGISYSSQWQWRHGAGVVCTHDLQQYKNYLFTKLWPAVLIRTCTCQYWAGVTSRNGLWRPISGWCQKNNKIRTAWRQSSYLQVSQTANKLQRVSRKNAKSTYHIPLTAVNINRHEIILSACPVSTRQPRLKFMHCNNDRWELIKPQQCTRDQIQRYSITAGTRCAEKSRSVSLSCMLPVRLAHSCHTRSVPCCQQRQPRFRS